MKSKSEYLSTVEVRQNLPMSEKIEILVEVSNMVVSRVFGYLPIIEKIMYEKAILEHCAGLDVFSGENFDINAFCDFLIANRGAVDRIVAEADPSDELRDACHAAVLYRVEHGVGSSLDYLLESLSGWIEKASQQEIDLSVIESLKELIPDLRSMDTADVAKAIIDKDPKITAIR